MKKKLLLVICLVLSIVLLGPNLLRTNVWADDDAIMDVDDNAATFTGSWPRSTNRILYYGDDYQYAVGSGGSATATATFTTAQVADITGRYQVYVRWTAGNARATNATYYIYDSTGAFKGNCIKDQRYNGGAWQFCAEVYLNSGRRGVVKIGNGNVPTSRYVCADAVRFVRVSKDKYDIVDGAGGDGNYNPTTGLDLTGSITTVTSVQISAPNSGQVIVNASGYFHFFNYGHQDQAGCWITTGTGTDVNHSVWAGEASAGNYMEDVPFSLTRIFSVSAGTQTYRLNCTESSGIVRLFRPHITAMFVPNSY